MIKPKQSTSVKYSHAMTHYSGVRQVADDDAVNVFMENAGTLEWNLFFFDTSCEYEWKYYLGRWSSLEKHYFWNKPP